MTDRDQPGGLWDPQTLFGGTPGPPPPADPAPPPPAPPTPTPTPPDPPPVDAAAPPWQPPAGPPPRSPDPSPGGNSRMMIGLGAAAAVLLVAAGLTFAIRASAGTGDDPPAPPPATRTVAPGPVVTITGWTPEPDPEPTTADPVADPQEDARAELARLHDEDRPTVEFRGQFVAQLASKNPGLTDEYQWAADGTHTFQATDILAEHLALRAEPFEDARVVLLLSTDYGKRQRVNGAPLWVTFALGDFGSKQDVLTWCARRFPDLSGAELGNQCAARNLNP